MKALPYTLLWVFFTFANLSWAQEKIRVSLFAVDYDPQHKTVRIEEGKKDAQDVRLSTANISIPISASLTDERFLNIKSTTPVQKEHQEAEMFYPVISSIKIPDGLTDVLLILVPYKGEASYKALVVDRDLKSFPMGSYNLINFTPSNITGLLGKTKVEARSHKITPFNPSKNTEKNFKVEFKYERNDRDWKTFAKTTWKNELGKRLLLCAYIDPRTKRYKIKGLPLREPLAERN